MVKFLKLTPLIWSQDILLVSTGNKLPADIRIIECTGDCTVDNASLTGEAEALEAEARTKQTMNGKRPEIWPSLEPLCPQDLAPELFFQTGQNTVMGRVQALATNTEHVETPISKKLSTSYSSFLALLCSSG